MPVAGCVPTVGMSDSAELSKYKKNPQDRFPADRVGLPEFESGTPSPPDLYANQLRYSPKCADEKSPIRLFTISKKSVSVNSSN